MPVTFIHGEYPGKTVLITSGIHPAESTGIQTSIQLAKELSSSSVHGKLIIIHLVNMPAFQEGNDITPEDGKNLNRVFPPNRNGTLTDKIAYFFWETFACKVDFYIDLHGCSAAWLNPHCYYVGVGEEHIIEESRQAAKLLNIPYITQSVSTNNAYNYAGTQGIPGILIERGQCGYWEQREVESFKKDVRNVLRHLQLLDGEMESVDMTPEELENILYLHTECDGCWIPYVQPDELFQKGEKLGEIQDCFGGVLQTYYAQQDGVGLYMNCHLSVKKNEFLFAYAAYSNFV